MIASAASPFAPVRRRARKRSYENPRHFSSFLTHGGGLMRAKRRTGARSTCRWGTQKCERRDAEFGGEIEGRLLSFSCLRLLPLLVCACAFGVHPDRQNVPECAMSVAHSKMTKRTQFQESGHKVCQGRELREGVARGREVGSAHPTRSARDRRVEFAMESLECAERTRSSSSWISGTALRYAPGRGAGSGATGAARGSVQCRERRSLSHELVRAKHAKRTQSNPARNLVTALPAGKCATAARARARRRAILAPL
jgi:hypothetical protein